MYCTLMHHAFIKQQHVQGHCEGGAPDETVLPESASFVSVNAKKVTSLGLSKDGVCRKITTISTGSTKCWSLILVSYYIEQ